MAKQLFNSGDRVQYVGSTTRSMRGRQGTVASISNGDIRVQWDRYPERRPAVVCRKNLALVTDTVPASMLNAGDTLVLTDEAHVKRRFGISSVSTSDAPEGHVYVDLATDHGIFFDVDDEVEVIRGALTDEAKLRILVDGIRELADDGDDEAIALLRRIGA